MFMFLFCSLTSCCHRKKGFLFLSRDLLLPTLEERKDSSTVVSQLYCFNFLKQVICYSLDVVSLHPSNKKSAQNQLGLKLSLAGLIQG